MDMSTQKMQISLPKNKIKAATTSIKLPRVGSEGGPHPPKNEIKSLKDLKRKKSYK